MTRNALGSIALQTMICHLSFHQHYLPTAGKIIMNFIYNVPLPVLKTSSKLQNNDDLTTVTIGRIPVDGNYRVK